jgi:hypothetical protein
VLEESPDSREKRREMERGEIAVAERGLKALRPSYIPTIPLRLFERTLGMFFGGPAGGRVWTHKTPFLHHTLKQKGGVRSIVPSPVLNYVLF